MKTAVVGMGVPATAALDFLFILGACHYFLRFIVFLFVATKSDEASRNSQCKYNVMFA